MSDIIWKQDQAQTSRPQLKRFHENFQWISWNKKPIHKYCYKAVKLWWLKLTIKFSPIQSSMVFNFLIFNYGNHKIQTGIIKPIND